MTDIITSIGIIVIFGTACTIAERLNPSPLTYEERTKSKQYSKKNEFDEYAKLFCGYGKPTYGNMGRSTDWNFF